MGTKKLGGCVCDGGTDCHGGAACAATETRTYAPGIRAAMTGMKPLRPILCKACHARREYTEAQASGGVWIDGYRFDAEDFTAAEVAALRMGVRPSSIGYVET